MEVSVDLSFSHNISLQKKHSIFQIMDLTGTFLLNHLKRIITLQKGNYIIMKNGMLR